MPAKAEVSFGVGERKLMYLRLQADPSGLMTARAALLEPWRSHTSILVLVWQMVATCKHFDPKFDV